MFQNVFRLTFGINIDNRIVSNLIVELTLKREHLYFFDNLELVIVMILIVKLQTRRIFFSSASASLVQQKKKPLSNRIKFSIT